MIQFLIEERKRQGMSQEGLAQLIGLHQQFISRVETGERRLDVVEFADMARALNLAPEELVADIPTAYFD